MIFISSGHNSQSKTIKADPGAVNKDGIREGDLTIEFKGLVQQALRRLNMPFTSDTEEESLAMWLQRAQTGPGSVVLEFHFDAAASDTATGCTALVGDDADWLDKAFAKELSDTTATLLGIRNRGVVSEKDSHRGRLGLMREQGIVSLLELGFITNAANLSAYHAHKIDLAGAIALILQKYEKVIA